jgi:hypothetical protein
MMSTPVSCVLPDSLTSRSMLMMPALPSATLAVRREGRPKSRVPKTSTERPLIRPTALPTASMSTVPSLIWSRPRCSYQSTRKARCGKGDFYGFLGDLGATVKTLYGLCRESLHLNFLTSRTPRHDVEPFYTDPVGLLRFALEDLSPRMTLRHGTVPDDVYLSVYRCDTEKIDLYFLTP